MFLTVVSLLAQSRGDDIWDRDDWHENDPCYNEFMNSGPQEFLECCQGIMMNSAKGKNCDKFEGNGNEPCFEFTQILEDDNWGNASSMWHSCCSDNWFSPNCPSMDDHIESLWYEFEWLWITLIVVTLLVIVLVIVCCCCVTCCATSSLKAIFSNKDKDKDKKKTARRSSSSEPVVIVINN